MNKHDKTEELIKATELRDSALAKVTNQSQVSIHMKRKEKRFTNNDLTLVEEKAKDMVSNINKALKIKVK